MARTVSFRTRTKLAILTIFAAIAPAHAADDQLPIFDAHVHYSSDAWVAYGPQAVFEKLDSAGVSWALVSSTPDDGTLALHSKNDRRIVPELRPYHDDFHAGNWYRTPEIIPYLEALLSG